MTAARPITLLALMLCLRIGAATEAADGSPGGAGWLMMVRTDNADPAREVEFNHWYDDIDIPDVLKVPGYLRARRGQLQAESPALQGKGRYIALYDIESTDIERTIESMNQLARDMPKQGRATPLLEVTERIYYRRYRGTREAASASATGAHDYLVVARFGLAKEADVVAFDAWYDGQVLDAVLAATGVLRATRYELYRVRMDDPVLVPRFLTVFEVAAADAVAAAATVDGALTRLLKKGGAGQTYIAGDANVYLQIKDVKRPTPAH